MLFIIANMLEKINESKISEWFNKANGISGIEGKILFFFFFIFFFLILFYF